MSDPNLHNDLRRIIAATICDLAGYLGKLPEPIVIGGQYPDTKLMYQIALWCAARNISVVDPDIEHWVAAVQSGIFLEGGPPTDA